jgi:hypothetical protein
MIPATRKVVTRSPAHSVRVLHLPHLQPEPVHADSNPERFFVQIAALYLHTRSIKHQPFKLVLGERTYTPDFLIVFADGSRLVVEVKAATKAEAYQDLFSEARVKLSNHGFEFMVALDVDITRDKLAARALRIRRYCKTRLSPADLRAALDAVRQSSCGVTLSDLTQVHGIKAEVLMHLVGMKLICTRKPLDISAKAVFITTEQFIEETQHETKTHAIQFTGWFKPADWDEDDRADASDF